jgi:hypothetical protein
MKRKVFIFSAKLIVFLIPVLLFFELLFLAGYTPIFTNSTLFDTKMMAVQKEHIKGVKIMALGSSITLFELNSELIVKNLDSPYYNFGSWGLQMVDMNNLITGYVNAYHPNYVIICSSISDFVSAQNDSYFNYINTPRWIKDHLPEYFYFKNFNSIHQVIRRKIKAYPLILDEWGGAPLRIKPTNKVDILNDRVVFPTKYTNENYNKLDSLASFLHGQHIQLIFMQSPIRNSRVDTLVSQQVLNTHFAACKAIVEKNGGVYLNYDNPQIYADSLFVGRYHLMDTGAIILTKEMIPDLKQIIK